MCLSRAPQKYRVYWSRAVKGAGEAEAALSWGGLERDAVGSGLGVDAGSEQTCEVLWAVTVVLRRGQGAGDQLAQPSPTPTSAA